MSWTASHCDCLFSHSLEVRGDEADWGANLEKEGMRVNPDNKGSVYADLSDIMCVPL